MKTLLVPALISAEILYYYVYCVLDQLNFKATITVAALNDIEGQKSSHHI